MKRHGGSQIAIIWILIGSQIALGAEGTATTQTSSTENTEVKEEKKVPSDCKAICSGPLATAEKNSKSEDTVTKQNSKKSQIPKYCAAHEAARGTVTWSAINLALDIGVAATCYTACFAKDGFSTAALEAACGAVGIAASVSEVTAVFAMKNSKAQRVITSIGAAAGGASGAAATVMGAKSIKEGKDKGEKLSKISNAKKFKKTASCYAAISFTALAAIRAAGLAAAVKTKKNSCSQIKTLARGESQTVLDPEVEPEPPLTSSAGNTDSGSNSSILDEGSFGCTGSDCNLNELESTESGIIVESDQEKFFGDIAAEKDPGRIADDYFANGFTKLLEDALGDQKDSDLGKNMIALANDIHDDPGTYQGEMDAAKKDGIFTGGGGGGGAGGGGKFSLGDLFGNKGEKTARNTHSTTIFDTPPDTDIWHKGSKLSIFEIISEKYDRAKKRKDVGLTKD